MQISEFEKDYGHRGGLKTLEYMVRVEFFTLDYIGKHFGVTRTQVASWIKDFLQEDYDPKIARKEKIIEGMLMTAEKFGMDLSEFREAFYLAYKDYYEIALTEAYARGIIKAEKE